MVVFNRFHGAKVATLLVATLLPCFAIASKSSRECALEVGVHPEPERQQLIYKCMFAPNPDPIPAAPIAPKSPLVYVQEFGIREVNSAGGVEPFAVFSNPNKTSAIKYITMYLALYNGVGDAIRSDIGGNNLAGISFTGPLKHDEDDRSVNWGPVWYNSTAKCIQIRSMSVEFMNGKRVSFSGKALTAALATDIENHCRVK